MGDPSGIGPEIIARAQSFFSKEQDYNTIVIGDADVLKQRIDMFNIDGKVNIISAIEEGLFTPGFINVLDLKNVNLSKLIIGTVQEMCGKASVEYIYKAVEYIKENKIHAMVTAPINKEAINKAGFFYAGHTELLSRITGTKKFAMMLAGEKLRVVLVTTHLAVSKVGQNITIKKIEEKIKLTDDYLKKYFAIKTPKIVICGLNPHIGENGLFGREEIEKIIPAINNMKNKKIDVSGPYPADTLFYKAQNGIYDAVLVMYHDQGLIPIKMLYMDSAVNITLGLPIIRTSVDHGTAFDIAEKGIASYTSLKSAIKLAAHMVFNNIT
ncbi:MAG: 4-hydroxythreonine-4-phosphate dehydrogenase PdxA [Candidatus Firestonebacteria bacterium]|nr:4-hydroxythreonine-4-phosphate dehydrogenase PdxA [Candidatus Firestonebacteria bacterium]